MIKTLNLLFVIGSLLLTLASPVFAQTISWTEGYCYTKDSSGALIANLQGFECIFANILLIIVPLAGLAAFVTLIIGGFQYLTSAGDPKQLQKATSTITAAIIGIVIILGVWFIFKLFHLITGLDLLQFIMPSSLPGGPGHPGTFPATPCPLCYGTPCGTPPNCGVCTGNTCVH